MIIHEETDTGVVSQSNYVPVADMFIMCTLNQSADASIHKNLNTRPKKYQIAGVFCHLVYMAVDEFLVEVLQIFPWGVYEKGQKATQGCTINRNENAVVMAIVMRILSVKYGSV